MKTQISLAVILTVLFVMLSLPPAMAQGQSIQDKTVQGDATQTSLGEQLPDATIISRRRGRPNPTMLEAGQNCQDAINQGEGLLKVGKVEEAIHSFQTAINYEHTDGLAYQRLAEAYTAAGQFDKAVDTYRKVMYNQLGPGVGNNQGAKVEVLMQFALLLQRTNHIEEAVTAYRRGAYLLNYRDSENHEGKPYLKVMLPTFGSGGDIPYTPQRLQALAHIAIAIETFSFGDKEALAHLREAVQLYPDAPVAHFYLGEQLHRMQNKEAKSAYAKAAALGDDQVVAAAQEALKNVR